MRLLEWQAKQLFIENKIPVPKSLLVSQKDELNEIEYPAVMKAQVPIGGRGKAGAIKRVANLAEAKKEYDRLVNLDVRGYIARSILVEEPVEIAREIYLSMLYDRQTNLPMIIASPVGGVDIEQVAREMPEKIIRLHFDLFLGIQQFMIRYLAKYLGAADGKGLEQIVRALYEIFIKHDATLVEINPLAETSGGYLALDAKVDLDDHAETRHAAYYEQLRREQTFITKKELTPAEKLAKEYAVKYVYLDGDVGIITDGAGTGMLTLDLVADEGGKPANFCELGGLAGPETAYNAIKVVLGNPNVKVLLITLIGGLTRMDEMGEGIARYAREYKQAVPFVIRMCGTKEEEGIALLKSVGLSAHNDINEAVREAVEISVKK